MACDSPIGIFDSGLGGLTVAKRILGRLPQESIIYVGDEAHVPYGERPAEQIKSFALGICDFLIRRKSKLIIMACNMSTATALGKARELYPSTPIVGVIEAGARAALCVPGNHPIGILATTGTVKTGAYTSTLRRFDLNTEAYEQACPRFVPLVEKGLWSSPEAQKATNEYIRPLLFQGCRTIILGCTHYPFLTDVIAAVAGSGVTIIDPAEETASEAERILRDTGTLNPGHAPAAHEFLTTAPASKFSELGSRFMEFELGSTGHIVWNKDLREIICQEKTEEETMKFAR